MTDTSRTGPGEIGVAPTLKNRTLGRLLFAIYLLVVLEDASRKVFGFSDIVLVGKEVLLAVVYVLYLPSALRRSNPIPPAPFFLAASVALWLFAQAYTPFATGGSLMLGLFAYLWHAPLAYVAAVYFTSLRSTRAAVRVVALTGTVIALGAVVSAELPGSASRLLEPISQEAGIRSFQADEIYLAPSLFATGEKAADQLLFSAQACLVLALLADRQRKLWGWLLVLGVVLGGQVATQRRAALGLTIVALLLIGLLTSAIVPRGRRRFRPRRVALIVVPIAAYLAATSIGGDAFLRFVSDRPSYDNVASTLAAVRELPRSIDGQGTGTATQGLDRFGLPKDRGVEGGLTKVWLEVGLLGVALYYGFLLTWLAPLALSYRRHLDLYGLGFAVTAFVAFLLGFKAHQIWDNPQFQIMFWLSVGAAWGRVRASLSGSRGNRNLASLRRSEQPSRHPSAVYP